MKAAVVHKLAGYTVLFVLTCFWLALVISDFFFDHDALAVVRQGIVIALAVLVPAIIVAEISGGKLGSRYNGNDALIKKKKLRAKMMAINGAIIMVPAAFFLYYKSANGEFDDAFLVVQVLELLVGSYQYYAVFTNVMGGRALMKEVKSGVGHYEEIG